MFLSIVIPVFNEEKIIAETIRRIINYLKNKRFLWEIIVIDDGSKDNSQQIIKNFSEIKLLVNERNQGKGEAVRKGILAAQGEWVLFLDADLSTDITEFAKFEPYLKSYEIIIGTRQTTGAQIIKNQPIYRVMLGRLGNLIIRTLLRLDIKDTQCGFKLFNQKCKKIFQKQTVKGWGFDFEILLLARRNGFKIKEVGIVWHDSAHTNIKAKSYFKTLLELLKIKLNILRKKYE